MQTSLPDRWPLFCSRLVFYKLCRHRQRLMDPGVQGEGGGREKHGNIYITTGKIESQWESAL